MDEAQKSSKIDMNHGFMKSIIRNQVDRDNYDKEVKSKSTDRRRGFPNATRAKKPDAAIYIPPVKNEQFEDDEEEESDEEDDDMPKTLFTLEFQDKDGKIYKQYVKEGFSAHFIAQRMGKDRKLTPAMTKALEQRIQEEIDKRTKKKKS